MWGKGKDGGGREWGGWGEGRTGSLFEGERGRRGGGGKYHDGVRRVDVIVGRSEGRARMGRWRV